jgi:hypothetical protein
MRGKGSKYLIRDRDKKYATHFSVVAGSIKELKTPYRTPQANGVCERFMGSLRREFLDHILIQDDKHLERVTTEYTMSYFNQERPHQGIGQYVPEYYDLIKVKANQRMRHNKCNFLGTTSQLFAHNISELTDIHLSFALKP